MAFASRKQPAVLRDDEVGGRLPGNKSEEGLSDLECDSENELDDCAVLDVEVDGDSDQDDIKDFVWEDMNNYKGDQLSFRIQLLEGLFVKYANVLEHKVSGRHSSDNTVPHLTKRYFISKIPPSEKKARPQRWRVCQ
jgi:hypothetical protein